MTKVRVHIDIVVEEWHNYYTQCGIVWDARHDYIGQCGTIHTCLTDRQAISALDTTEHVAVLTGELTVAVDEVEMCRECLANPKTQLAILEYSDL